MTWISPKEQLPPQAKKILAFYCGDCWVVQRVGKYWIPIPFTDSKFSRTDQPDLWKDIEMPEGYSGKMFFEINGEILELDKVEKKFTEEYTKIVSIISNIPFEKKHK